MRLSEYVDTLDFDLFETYKYNDHYDVFAITIDGTTQFFLKKSFEEVPNSILFPDYRLNPSSKLVYKSTAGTLEAFKSILGTSYQSRTKNVASPTYNDAVVFKKAEQIIGGFDVSFVNYSIKKFDNQTLEVAE